MLITLYIKIFSFSMEVAFSLSRFIIRFWCVIIPADSHCSVSEKIGRYWNGYPEAKKCPDCFREKPESGLPSSHPFFPGEMRKMISTAHKNVHGKTCHWKTLALFPLLNIIDLEEAGTILRPPITHPFSHPRICIRSSIQQWLLPTAGVGILNRAPSCKLKNNLHTWRSWKNTRIGVFHLGNCCFDWFIK